MDLTQRKVFQYMTLRAEKWDDLLVYIPFWFSKSFSVDDSIGALTQMYDISSKRSFNEDSHLVLYNIELGLETSPPSGICPEGLFYVNSQCMAMEGLLFSDSAGYRRLDLYASDMIIGATTLTIEYWFLQTDFTATA